MGKAKYISIGICAGTLVSMILYIGLAAIEFMPSSIKDWMWVSEYGMRISPIVSPIAEVITALTFLFLLPLTGGCVGYERWKNQQINSTPTLSITGTIAGVPIEISYSKDKINREFI